MFSDQMRRVSEVSFNNLPLDKSFKGKSDSGGIKTTFQIIFFRISRSHDLGDFVYVVRIFCKLDQPIQLYKETVINKIKPILSQSVSRESMLFGHEYKWIYYLCHI